MRMRRDPMAARPKRVMAGVDSEPYAQGSRCAGGLSREERPRSGPQPAGRRPAHPDLGPSLERLDLEIIDQTGEYRQPDLRLVRFVGGRPRYGRRSWLF